MKRTYAITTFAALAFATAGSLFTLAASAEDAMKSETTKPESMKADHMKADHMNSDSVKTDTMKSGHTGDDAMGSTQK
jgi:pentapeptide MXKDX repeat protein